MIMERLKDYALEVLSFSWPMVVISVIVAISLRLTYLIANEKRFILYKELFMLAALVYVLCLFQVVTYRDVNWTGANYTPFKEIFRYKIGSSLFFRNVFGNMIMFMPYGLFVAIVTKTDKYRYVFLLASIASLSIELTQLAIGRVFDIDDVILNVLGALVGLAIYKLCLKIKHRVPDMFKSEMMLNILSIVLFGGLIWFLIP